MNDQEARLARLEAASGDRQSAHLNAWLATVSDDDIDTLAGVAEFYQDGGGEDALTARQRAIIGRLDEDRARFG